MNVAVLPTGRTEWNGLARALKGLFSDHKFYALPTKEEVSSNPLSFPYRGFTSLKLQAKHEKDPPQAACDLVARAAQEALGDRRHPAADLVIIVDDLELANAEKPERVVSVMRRAIQIHLNSLKRVDIRARTQEVLRTKVSFHLIAPMIEAWFFADSDALSRAGVEDVAAVCFPKEIDPESFITEDEAYLAAKEADCPALAALRSRDPRKLKKKRPKWLGSGPRDRHPKGYLQWLCRALERESCTRYSETKDGGLALAKIRWKMLLDRQSEHFQFLRALIEDLEEGFGDELVFNRGSVSCLTDRSQIPRDAVLRNL